MSELARAHATLLRGADFMAGWLTFLPPCAAAVSHAHRSKVIANGLRELDRFLSILIDEVCRRRRLPVPAGQRNTAAKLRTLREALERPHPDHARLLALGRSRDCLFFCGGVVKRGDSRGGTVMTLGWPHGCGRDSPLRRAPVGAAVVVTARDIESVCELYRGIADDLFEIGRLTA